MPRHPRIPETATVTVSAAVDGTVHRKGRGPGRRAALDYHHTVDPEVWATAQRIVRPGERFVRVTDTEVRSVYLREKRENE